MADAALTATQPSAEDEQERERRERAKAFADEMEEEADPDSDEFFADEVANLELKRHRTSLEMTSGQ